ncbi:hypothetical protein [Crassaminicella profunda]|uniref:hypothetical protein n=1 Tax=Crassaminicella profunda TaxID=1286698 RepID=UPI001CA6358B|nr:hypothetical protein [Crassaminicella profunda]QZY55198.1 hypothetical protein K7H06_19700 [Crassaminicella profunda]
MKKWLICILAVVLILGGCTDTENNPSDEINKNKEMNEEVEKPIQKDQTPQEEKKLSKEDEEKIMIQYNDLLTKGKPYEVLAFIDKNILELSEENADEIIQGLEKIQKQYKNEYTEILMEDDLVKQNQLHKIFGYKFNKRKVESIEDEDLKALVVEMIKGGYKFVTLEGSFYPMIDYGYLKKYQPYVSDEMRAYIEIVSRESDQFTWNGNVVNISWKVLGNRTLQAESYLRKYPDSAMRNEVANLYMMYIGAFMNGSKNMPLLDPETNQLNDKILKNYRDLISDNEGSITAEVIKEYVDAMEKNDFKIDDTIMELSNNIHQKVIEKLNLGDGLTDYNAQ